MYEDANYLVHSAKGTSWSKKDHKYVKKINGVYYYGTKTQLNAIDDLDKTVTKLNSDAERFRAVSSEAERQKQYWNEQHNKNLAKANKFDQENANPMLNAVNQKTANKYKAKAENATAQSKFYANKAVKNAKAAADSSIKASSISKKMSEVSVSVQVQEWIKRLFKK